MGILEQIVVNYKHGILLTVVNYKHGILQTVVNYKYFALAVLLRYIAVYSAIAVTAYCVVPTTEQWWTNLAWLSMLQYVRVYALREQSCLSQI